MHRSRSLRLLSLSLVALACVWAKPAAAQSQLQLQQQSKSDHEGQRPLPVHATASLTSSLGSGTFVISPNNPTFEQTLTLNPLFSWDAWTVLVNQRIGLEWTNSENTTYARQLDLSDTVVGVRWSGLRLPEQGMMLLISAGYQVPISMQSRWVGSLGTPTLGARGIWNINSINLSSYAAVGAGYSILSPGLAAAYQRSVPAKPYADRVFGTTTPATCNPRNDTELTNYGCLQGGLPTEFRWNATMGTNWSFGDGAFALGMDLGYNQGFSAFIGPDDEFTAGNAVPGLVPRQSTSGNLSLSWIPQQWLYVTGGFFSMQPAFTADGKWLRFPLWDFVSPYSNFSSIYLDLTVAI